MPEKDTPFKFDEVALRQKIEKIKEHMDSFVGKPNRNPFLWIHKNVVPLLTRLQKGEKSEELAKAIENLKEVDPIVNPELEKSPPKEEKPKTVLTPGGLKLKEK